MLLKLFLPLSLAVIMFSLGLGLTLNDFGRILSRPTAFATGAINQIFLLPIIAFIIILMFGLSGELAVGLMILSFCPGGVTSNMLTRIAGGDVALSVTLTGVISLLSMFTVPLLLAFSVGYFMGLDAPEVSITSLAISMFLITTVPVALGMLVRHFLPRLAAGLDAPVAWLAAILFILIVVAAIALNWDTLVENLPILGPAVITLNIVLLAAGTLSGRMFGADKTETTAVSIETGIQNATLGITAGSLIAESAAALPPFSLPSAVYGVTMYIVTLPFVFWRRHANRK